MQSTSVGSRRSTSVGRKLNQWKTIIEINYPRIYHATGKRPPNGPVFIFRLLLELHFSPENPPHPHRAHRWTTAARKAASIAQPASRSRHISTPLHAALSRRITGRGARRSMQSNWTRLTAVRGSQNASTPGDVETPHVAPAGGHCGRQRSRGSDERRRVFYATPALIPKCRRSGRGFVRVEAPLKAPSVAGGATTSRAPWLIRSRFNFNASDELRDALERD